MLFYTCRIQKYISFILIGYLVLSGYSVMAQIKNYDIVPVCELNLNRKAKSLSSAQLATVSPAKKGFIWNDDDNETLKYRPQGITDVFLKCRKYIGVTWYGRKETNWGDRGVRVSLVDITDMDAIAYRHILLVDEDNKTFKNMHGGGLHFLNDKLYVPDTRSSSSHKIYEFDINAIKRVPNEDLSKFYNYRYILKRTATYDVSIRPSCLSYDWDSQEFIIATFKKECDFECVFNDDSTFSWFKTANANNQLPFHKGFFDRIQGMASMDDYINTNKKIMWTSQSYGRTKPSSLFVTTYNRNPNNSMGQKVDISSLNYTKFELPPGLEDLHLEQDNHTLWSLTEFSPNEGIGNERMVFAFSRADILPKGYPLNVKEFSLEQKLNNIKLFPNPNSGNFTIDLGKISNVEFNLYDTAGRTVYTSNFFQKLNEVKLKLATGIYWAEFISDEKSKSTMVMIE